jgi:outer membrane protein OmpA-like peptidoglycan-associated protein
MKPILTLLAISIGLAILPMESAAQNVRDFTGHEPTREELIDVLKPRDGMQTRGLRGIAPVETTAPTQPECTYYRKQLSRGIKPVSDAAALKVTFAFNSAELTAEAKQTLDTLGAALQSHELQACCFQVEGHTDSVGGDAYNTKLSQARARSVARYLKDRYDIDIERLLTVGLGENKPIADNDTEEGRQKNRRVQVVNLGYGQPTAP